MIYLIESVGRDKNDNKIKSFLKIGYSGDKKFDRRLDTYFLHNPHCDLLYKIPGGTQDQEKLLHYKFKNYLVYRKEWFVDDSGEIIDFFKTHLTVESLEKEFGTANPTYFIRDITGKVTKEFREIKDGIRSILCKFYNRQVVPGNLNTEDLLTLYRTTADKYIKEIGRTIFSIEDFKKSFTEGSLDCLDDCSVDIENSTVLSFLIEFNNLTLFTEKMRLLCESTLGKEDLNIILDQIPLAYKSFFTVLGPERCKRLKYQSGGLEEELKSQLDSGFNLNILSKEILKNFQEGETYTKKEIKKTLGEIYNKLGYRATPKATVLGKYFDLKCSKKLVNEKREEAFKLIKKKI